MKFDFITTNDTLHFVFQITCLKFPIKMLRIFVYSGLSGLHNSSPEEVDVFCHYLVPSMTNRFLSVRRNSIILTMRNDSSWKDVTSKLYISEWKCKYKDTHPCWNQTEGSFRLCSKEGQCSLFRKQIRQIEVRGTEH